MVVPSYGPKRPERRICVAKKNRRKNNTVSRQRAISRTVETTRQRTRTVVAQPPSLASKARRRYENPFGAAPRPPANGRRSTAAAGPSRSTTSLGAARRPGIIVTAPSVLLRTERKDRPRSIAAVKAPPRLQAPNQINRPNITGRKNITLHDTRSSPTARNKNRCKERPKKREASKRGAGASREFIPWCGAGK